MEDDPRTTSAMPVRQVEAAGHRLTYRMHGEGPPLLLLHGWPSNSREWSRQLRGLSDEFTVVAWDAPGAGQSSDPPEEFGLGDWADCLAAFIDELGLGRPHVAGLSWGGGLALELYRRHPAVPRTLVLVSAYAGWAGSLPPDVVAERLHVARQISALPPAEWPASYLRTLVGGATPPAVIDEIRSIFGEFHPAATRVAGTAFAEADLRDVLPTIAVPTLVVCGDQDVRAPEAVWRPLHTAIPNSTLVRIPGVGHMIDIEAGERLNGVIREFLRAVPPA